MLTTSIYSSPEARRHELHDSNVYSVSVPPGDNKAFPDVIVQLQTKLNVNTDLVIEFDLNEKVKRLIESKG